MKIKLHKHGLLITGIAVLAFLFIASCTTTPASRNQVNENEVRAQQEAIQQAEQEEREARQVRATIVLNSDYTGKVLINGEETRFNAIAGDKVKITIENAVGNEYTFAVRESTGIIHHDNSKILIERGLDSTGQIFSYNASIINTSPNDPGDFNVVQNANGITITSYKGTRKRVNIPETLYGQRVTTIGDYAFYKKGIVSVIIPNSVVTIENRAFYYENTINEVVIPDSVKSIGSWAFMSCGLTKVTIGRGVQFIDENAFGNNTISEFIILAPLTSYDRRVTGKERIAGLGYVDAYSQTLGLHPTAFNWVYGSSLQSARITLPANIHDGNIEAFPTGLVGYYKNQGKRAGTYVLNGPVWTRE